MSNEQDTVERLVERALDSLPPEMRTGQAVRIAARIRDELREAMAAVGPVGRSCEPTNGMVRAFAGELNFGGFSAPDHVIHKGLEAALAVTEGGDPEREIFRQALADIWNKRLSDSMLTDDGMVVEAIDRRVHKALFVDTQAPNEGYP